MHIAKDAPSFIGFCSGSSGLSCAVIVRPDVAGVEHVPLIGPLVVSCNHLHALDIPAVGLVSHAGRPRSPRTSGGANWAAGSWSTERASSTWRAARRIGRR